jgi:hypothetical protein
MRPPYDPGHVERVRKPATQEYVEAMCSCTPEPLGGRHRLGRPDTARLLAADFDAHRVTYADLSRSDAT